MAAFDVLARWAVALTNQVNDNTKAIRALQTSSTTLPERVATLEADVAALNARVNTQDTTILSMQTSLNSLQGFLDTLDAPFSFIATINAERNPFTMAFEIVDSDTTKVASILEVDDALGFATSDPVTTVWSSSDVTIANIDPSTGAITPVAPGACQALPVVTAADGTALVNAGDPLDITILTGPAVSFKATIS